METNTMITGTAGDAYPVAPVSAVLGTGVACGGVLSGGVSAAAWRVRFAGVRPVEKQRWVKPLTVDAAITHNSTGVSVPGQLPRYRT
ncbi:MAG: hypothetical protein OJJ54_05045 [Pseudonocardia sp.]|nr:hypothetical protein [Pseudonocardia sp.]